MKAWSTNDRLAHVDLNANFAEAVADIGWQRISTANPASGILSVGFSLPTGYDRYRVEFESVIPSASSMLTAVISEDNGVSFVSSYTAAKTGFSGTAAIAVADSAAFLSLMGAPAPGACSGYLEIDPFNYHLDGRASAPLSTAWTRADVAASWVGTKRPTNVALLYIFSGISFVSGRFRLLGAQF